jgi:pimeloyl-ACP methyl ester carboxylesterase
MAPDRFSDWIEDLERAPTRRRRRLSLDQATARLATSFPLWPREAARLMARYGTREDDGALVWRFDPLHQTRSPQPYFVSQARAFWQRIRCPVLYVEGERSRAHAAALGIEERIEEIGARRATIAGAGHHPHLEKPDDLAPILAEFLGALPGSRAAHRRAGRG